MDSEVVTEYVTKITTIVERMRDLSEEIKKLSQERSRLIMDLVRMMSTGEEVVLYHVGKTSSRKIETKETCEWIHAKYPIGVFVDRDSAQSYILDTKEEYEMWEVRVSTDHFLNMYSMVCVVYTGPDSVPKLG